MKNKFYLLLIAMFAAAAAIAQPNQGGVVLSETEELTQVNDTTWILKYIRVEDNGITGSPDTIIRRAELDSAGVVTYKFTQSANQTITDDAIIGQAMRYRLNAALFNSRNSDISTFTGGAVDYYELAVGTFTSLLGRYRVFTDSAGVDVNFFADLEVHPNGARYILRQLDGDLQATGQTWVVLPRSQHGFQIQALYSLGNKRLAWDWQSTERKIFRDVLFSVAAQTSDDSSTRFVKIE